MDLILGLPGEGEAEVKNTMEEIKKLSPESLTVHTLAVKRASRLKETLGDYDLAKAMLMENILGLSAKGAAEMGLAPYYMYRQKNMLGSLSLIHIWTRIFYNYTAKAVGIAFCLIFRYINERTDRIQFFLFQKADG